MTLFPAPGSVVDMDWHQSAEGKEYLGSILRKNKRKFFGLTERPVLPPQVAADTVCYKIFVSGKAGVGKTAMVAKLVGLEVPSVHHETTGIQTTIVYWPVKLKASARVLMFKLQFWDCGEAALKKFHHILPMTSPVDLRLQPCCLADRSHQNNGNQCFLFLRPECISEDGPLICSHMSCACKEKADAVLFLFSFTDRSSFEDLPHQISRVLEGSENFVRIVIGTKFDQYMHTDVMEHDLADFQHTWHLPVLRMKSVNGPRLVDGLTLDGRAELADVENVLNRLAEHLWYHDQVAAGLVPAIQSS